MAIFSKGEMTRRMAGLRQGLQEKGLDACFLHSADNVYYTGGVPLLSEWGRPMWLVLTAEGESALCGAMIEKENMEANAAVDEILVYDDDENVVEAALRLCAEFLSSRVSSGARIGIERGIIPLALHERLQAWFPEAAFSDATAILEDLRLVKSAEELELLELGGRIARIGADAFLEALHENATELAVAAHAVQAMDKALGALSNNAGTSTYAYAQFGDHTLIPHLHPTSRRLQRGDLVSLNVFPVIWGYCAELERTFVFGEPGAERQKALDAVNEAFDAGKEAVRPGATAREIEELTRGILRRHGYDRYIRHGTGHAHGIMIGSAGREEPGEIRIYNERRLAPNMANSVEPGIYLPELGGFRHSDVLFVTEDGARCVTEFPRDIPYGA